MSYNSLLNLLFLPFFWALIFIIITSIGVFCIPFKKNEGIQSVNLFTWFWYGLGLLISYLQIWNLFCPINIYTWLIVLPFILLGLKKLTKFLKQNPVDGSFNFVILFFLLGVIIFLALSSLDNSFIYDSLVYHFYTIKWYNNLPVTKGMGNLFIYLGLNQSYFLFPAFLNSLWGNYKGACATNGFFALVICSEIILSNAQYLKTKAKLSFKSIFQLVFLPLCINVGVQNLSSPTPDVFVNLLTFKIFSEIIGIIEQKKVYYQDVFLLSFFCLLGIIMKLSFIGVSVGVLILLIYFIITNKLFDGNLIFQSSIIFCLLLIPWVIRGIISSGYIAFPISAFGLPVDWKMPKEVLIGLSDFIKGFARSHLHGQAGIDAAHNNIWVKGWISRMLQTVGFILPFSALVVCLIISKIKKIQLNTLLIVLLPLFISVVFWFFTAPDIRFAVFSFWALGIIPIAFLLSQLNLIKTRIFLILIAICSGLVIIKNWNAEISTLGDVPKSKKTIFITKSGLHINTIKGTPPDDNWQLGDCDIPCSVYPDSNLVLRLNLIGDGFKINKGVK